MNINAADLDIEVLRQDTHLDGPAPGIRRLDPAAVIVGALLQDDLGVGLGLRLDGARHEGAQFRHGQVVAGEDGRGEGAEETAVIVGHDAEH